MFQEKGVPAWFAREVGYRLVGRKGGFSRDVVRVYDDRVAAQFISAAEMRARQLAKLVSLLKHAEANCPYYTDLFRQVGFDPGRVTSVEDLSVLPALSKADLLANRDRMVSRLHPVSELNLNSTGGSTGMTVSFYQDRNWSVHQVAGGRFSDSMAGWTPGCRTAYLWGAPGDNKASLSGRIAALKSVLTNVRVYDSFDMSDAHMATYHEQLTRFRPDVLTCYAGSAKLYADFILANKLKVTYPVKAVITSAETLTEDMRRTIEAAFGVPVFDRYGSREVGAVGAECDQHTGLHVNEFDMVVESDPSLNGELLVTNLNNFGMPLIRYRIGDVAQLDPAPCACGRPGARITRLFGRSSDFFTTESGRKVHGEYFTHLFYGQDAIARFQFVQETLTEFHLRIVRNPGHWDDGVETHLREELAKVFGDRMALTIESVDAIPSTASGKFRFTISKV